MVRNYLLVTLRNLRRQKAFAAINVLGLAIGMACCILIALFVRDELSYDRWHGRADRIVRVTRQWPATETSMEMHMAAVPAPLAPKLRQDFPELAVARLINQTLLIGADEEAFYQRQAYFAEPQVFEIFTFALERGALGGPYTAVLTQRAARRYFGDQDPLGQMLRVEDSYDITVSGIMRDLPHNSHFDVDLLISFSTLQARWNPENADNWGGNNYYTYALLPAAMERADLQALMPAFLRRHVANPNDERSKLVLQPLTDIHLHSHLEAEIGVNGDIAYVRVLALVGVLVLIVACANFTNLSTARAGRRAREVGTRKSLGAQRRQLVLQFLGESLVLALLALVLALALVELALPWFRGFSEKPLGLDYLGDGLILPALGAVALVTGLLAGIYPALYLASVRSVAVLKGVTGQGRFRSWLVAGQLGVAVGLIACTAIIHQQVQFCRQQRLGVDAGQVVTIGRGGAVRDRFEAFRAELVGHPGIVEAAMSSRIPSGRLLDGWTFDIAPANGPLAKVPMRAVSVTPHFFRTYGIEVAAGRLPKVGAAGEYAVNEAAVKALGLAGPADLIGARVPGGEGDGRIVGVVRDFHFESFHQAIRPTAYFEVPGWLWWVSVRLAPGDPRAGLAVIEKTWQRFNPGQPLEYQFADESYRALYRAEERWAQILQIFSVLTVLVACLGLAGLAAYATEQRRKEIGVRKVLGASAAGLVGLFSRQSALLVGAASLVAWPLAFLLMRQWLAGFEYRIALTVWPFFLAGCLILAVTCTTVGYQALRAARADPVIALRGE
ncbi:MAG: FtsX-like permease family protein [Candidatus Latescibacteria bacterium]|nr:FtsX-like permease family protein [Candidatus Latescibacterota bacterium]